MTLPYSRDFAVRASRPRHRGDGVLIFLPFRYVKVVSSDSWAVCAAPRFVCFLKNSSFNPPMHFYLVRAATLNNHPIQRQFFRNAPELQPSLLAPIRIAAALLGLL
jgi:hypothetical protein